MIIQQSSSVLCFETSSAVKDISTNKKLLETVTFIHLRPNLVKVQDYNIFRHLDRIIQ
jgi:hypothetical protein